MFDEQFSMILSFLIGCGSGISVGIASGTAESFMIPFVTIVLAQSIYQAIGTSLFVDCMIGGAAGLIFLLKGNVKLKPVLILGAAGMLAAVAGSLFTTGASESGLKLLIVVVLISLGIALIRGGVKKNVALVNQKVNLSWFREHKLSSFVLFGSLIGFTSGFTGMGSSGAMTFVLIFIMEYDLHASIGTSLIMMFFIAGTGALTHGIQGDILLSVAIVAGLGAIIGATVGSLSANKINEDLLGRIIGVIITILGILVLIEYIF